MKKLTLNIEIEVSNEFSNSQLDEILKQSKVSITNETTNINVLNVVWDVNETRKVIAIPGYYEIVVRYANMGEKGQRYNGADGLFAERDSLFDSIGAFLSYLDIFEDDYCLETPIFYHIDLKDEMSKIYDKDYIDTLTFFK